MRRAVFFLGVLALCAGLTGCQPSKAAKEAREAGIASLDAGDYNAAIQSFEEALEDAKRKFTGPNPHILALPQTFKLGAVHLCMADDDLSTV